MQKWTHADIEWHLDPPPDTPLLKRLQMKVAANAIRTELILKGEACPPILCPKGGQAVLIGYDKAKGTLTINDKTFELSASNNSAEMYHRGENCKIWYNHHSRSDQ
jgi:hypothetical protein